jgi:hypothetical protein
MMSWLAWTMAAFVLSIVSAYVFLRLRYRGVGRPFGPRARRWAVTIILITATVSTGLGLALEVVTRRVEVISISLVLPSSLWLSKLLPQRNRVEPPGTLARWLTLPFSRLYDRMGEDMQDWCDTRLEAARPNPQFIADGVTYYYNQVRGQLKDSQAAAQLADWQESITHKISIVRLIDLDTNPARLRTSLQMHRSTQDARRLADDDLPRLARRLETEALNELALFLAYVYQLGFTQLLIYPWKPQTRTGPRMGETARLTHPELQRSRSTFPVAQPEGTPAPMETSAHCNMSPTQRLGLIWLLPHIPARSCSTESPIPAQQIMLSSFRFQGSYRPESSHLQG